MFLFLISFEKIKHYVFYLSPEIHFPLCYCDLQALFKQKNNLEWHHALYLDHIVMDHLNQLSLLTFQLLSRLISILLWGEFHVVNHKLSTLLRL